MAFAANGPNNSIDDGNGNEVARISATASAVNDLTLVNAATGNRPRLQASGDDTNISPAVRAKGTGGVVLEDGNGNEVVVAESGVASAVNEVGITNAATGNGPTVAARGGDTDVDLNLSGKNAGRVRIRGALSLPDDLTPTGLSGDQDNYSPTGLSGTSILRVDPNGASRNITGLAGGVDGRVVILVNIADAAENLVLKHDVTSTAANRFYTPGAADFTIGQYGSAMLIYDATLSRWLVLAKS